MYLLDTNVVSALAQPRATPPALVQWLNANTASLYLSAVTVTEVVSGIAKARRERAVRKAERLELWFESILAAYGVRVLVCDIAVARVAGALVDQARAAGRPAGVADILIAATAARHGLTVLTRNLKHFAPLGVPAHDPFAPV